MRTPAFLFILLLWPFAASAHPHAFIDLKTTIVLNEKGEVTAIKEHWVFDQYYTEFALNDFAYKRGGALTHDKLMELAHENLKGLKEFSYFTYPKDKAVKLGDATDINSYMENKRIAMEFTLPLITPTKPPFNFRIYDPSYYTAMLHEKGGLTVNGTLPHTCNPHIIKPNPGTAWTSLAAALDRNAQAPDDLGTYFAETVSLTCN